MAKIEGVNIHEAKTHLSRLVDQVSAGASIVIAKAGKPVAMLVPLDHARQPRKPGFLKGRIRIADDFDSPLPDEVIDEFEAGR